MREKTKRRKLVEAARQFAKLDSYNARRIAAEPNWFYGDTGTIHNTGHLSIEVHNGEVVSVWFRCQRLPFEASEVSTSRAESLSNWADQLPAINGIELVGK